MLEVQKVEPTSIFPKDVWFLIASDLDTWDLSRLLMTNSFFMKQEGIQALLHSRKLRYLYHKYHPLPDSDMPFVAIGLLELLKKLDYQLTTEFLELCELLITHLESVKKIKGHNKLKYDELYLKITSADPHDDPEDDDEIHKILHILINRIVHVSIPNNLIASRWEDAEDMTPNSPEYRIINKLFRHQIGYTLPSILRESIISEIRALKRERGSQGFSFKEAEFKRHRRNIILFVAHTSAFLCVLFGGSSSLGCLITKKYAAAALSGSLLGVGVLTELQIHKRIFNRIGTGIYHAGASIGSNINSFFNCNNALTEAPTHAPPSHEYLLLDEFPEQQESIPLSEIIEENSSQEYKQPNM